MELNNYDRTAGFYDFLSRAIFFRAQVKAQTNQLRFIPAGCRVLIVGGGTGWILEEIAKVHPAGLHITYIEISASMIEKAKKRAHGNNAVHYIHSPIETYTDEARYDVIQTAFLFDNFSAGRIDQVFSKLHNLLKPDGLWLFSDFNPRLESGRIWKSILLHIMYFFFRVIANVEAKKLTDITPWFDAEGYTPIDQRQYYRHFIKSIIFQRPGKSLPSSKITNYD
jgi:ubiquinone/menaquinone biosynthesis C-methylase UbiE